MAGAAPRSLALAHLGAVLAWALLGCGARSDVEDWLGEEPAQPPLDWTEDPPSCDNTAEPIIVLTGDNEIYRFWPDTQEFELVGMPSCALPGEFTTPNSMAVSRDGTAWINYVGPDPLTGELTGGLYRASLQDLSCEPAGVELPSGWFAVGMAFLRRPDGETLYLASPVVEAPDAPTYLGRVEGGSVVQVGPFGPLVSGGADLSGSEGGRLFGFFRDDPMKLAEIDPSSGDISAPVSLTGLSEPAGWADAIWGGDFYLFTADAVALWVSRYRPATKAFERDYMPSIPFKVVGADSFACVPSDEGRQGGQGSQGS